MKAFVVDKYKKQGALRLADVPAPELRDDDVMVRAHATAVNLLDSKVRDGEFKLFLPYRPPFILGHDVAGIVTRVGPNVRRFKAGDEVYARPRDHRVGTFAEFIAVNEADVALKPKNISMEEAASIPLVGLTAWQALVDTAGVGAGSRVLINGAAGGIGHLAVQIAKARGAHVTALASAADLDFVRSLGADEAIDYTTDFTATVRDQDVVLDVVGGDYPARALDVLKPGGMLVSTQPPSVAAVADAAAQRDIRVAGVIVEADEVGMAALADLAARGQLVPTIAATFPLEEARAASAMADLAATGQQFPLEQGGATESGRHGPGKVVLTME